MKKTVALLLALTLGLLFLPGCGSPAEGASQPDADSAYDRPPPGKKVTLNVFTTFAENDGNALNYQASIAAWQQMTGNSIHDTSIEVDEEVKAEIRASFAAGSEPDLLFYFTGADADSFLDKVISVDEIRNKYSDYASNMNEEFVPKGSDGTWYAVPVNGYWESLFVNKAVLKQAGVDVPGAGYTWEQFLRDCEAVKGAGFTPIAAGFADVPHYWWEYCIFNNGSAENHLTIPQSITDEAGITWVKGMKDVKELYDKGYFPENVTTEKDEAQQKLFYSDQAAFLIDGSWRAGTIKETCTDVDGNLDLEKLSKFTVVCVPGKGERKATDMITGISEGWYITKKAWQDPDKRAVCVDFVEYMTSDKKVSLFTGTGASALKNGVTLDEREQDSLDKDILSLMKTITSSTPAVQDRIASDVRNAMFQDVSRMLEGNITPEKLVENFLMAYQN